MEFIDSPAKVGVLRALVKNKGTWLGIRRISELSGVSVSIVWRQIPTLLRYGIVMEKRKGAKYHVYKLNARSRLAQVLCSLYTVAEKEAVPTRTPTVKYEKLKRAKIENFEGLVAVMDAFEGKRGGGRPKLRGETLALAVSAKEAWKRAEASGEVIAEAKRLRINVG
jgi:hypothetical protein